MSDYTELRGTGRISTAIRELQKDAGRRTVGGPGVLVDETTRGRVVRINGRLSNPSTTTTNAIVPRWG